MNKTLSDHLTDVINQNPGLIQWKKQLLGSCCNRRQPDSLVRNRILDFVSRWPQWRTVLTPLLKEENEGTAPF